MGRHGAAPPDGPGRRAGDGRPGAPRHPHPAGRGHGESRRGSPPPKAERPRDRRCVRADALRGGGTRQRPRGDPGPAPDRRPRPGSGTRPMAGGADRGHDRPAAVGQQRDGRLRDPRRRYRTEPRRTPRSCCAWPARYGRARPPSGAWGPARRSASRPARRCRPVRMPSSRSSRRRHSTPRATRPGHAVARRAGRCPSPAPCTWSSRWADPSAIAATISGRARPSSRRGRASVPAPWPWRPARARTSCRSTGGRASASWRPATRSANRGSRSARRASPTRTDRACGRSSRARAPRPSAWALPATSSRMSWDACRGRSARSTP